MQNPMLHLSDGSNITLLSTVQKYVSNLCLRHKLGCYLQIELQKLLDKSKMSASQTLVGEVSTSVADRVCFFKTGKV